MMSSLLWGQPVFLYAFTFWLQLTEVLRNIFAPMPPNSGTPPESEVSKLTRSMVTIVFSGVEELPSASGPGNWTEVL